MQREAQCWLQLLFVIIKGVVLHLFLTIYALSPSIQLQATFLLLG